MQIKKTLWVFLFLPFLGLLAFVQPSGDKYFEIAKNLDIFATLFKEVNTHYVDEIQVDKMVKTGIDAMLNSLDPYTNYIPEDEIEDYRTMTTGQYGGIGAMIGRRNNIPTVLMPYENYPANKAGLMIGDELLEIDGLSVGAKGTTDISKLLKGQAGTKIKLKVKRFGTPSPFIVDVTREKIKIENVPYFGMVNGTVGYVQLSDFTQDAAREVKKAVVELKSKGAQSIIFDLRDNPGGLLTEAINICNLFLPKDVDIVNTKSKVVDWNKRHRSLNSPLDTAIPLAVLLSPRSASAAEIVSGVIQDYDRGVLIGQRSFGKGLVQTTRPLSYNSQLKVTTAKYYIPSGRCIQAIDYSHRGNDGNPHRVPDSLRIAFKTTGGRIVFDGGGISPDIEIPEQPLTPISQSLMQKGLIFDYATQYRIANKELRKDFAVTDPDFKAFATWLTNKEYDYTTKVEATITDLEAHATKENYLAEIKDQILALRKRMSHNKELDLEKNKAEISELLEQEIISRYRFEKGIIEASFDDDPEIKEALKALATRQTYKNAIWKQNR